MVMIFSLENMVKTSNTFYVLASEEERKTFFFQKIGITRPVPRANIDVPGVYTCIYFFKVSSKTKTCNIIEQTTDTYWENCKHFLLRSFSFLFQYFVD